MRTGLRPGFHGANGQLFQFQPRELEIEPVKLFACEIKAPEEIVRLELTHQLVLGNTLRHQLGCSGNHGVNLVFVSFEARIERSPVRYQGLPRQNPA